MQWDETTPLSPANLNDLESRIDQASANIDTGKGKIATAINAMGQAAAGSDSFDTLAAEIKNISKDANADVGDVVKDKTFYQGGTKKTGTLALSGSAGAGDLLAGKTMYTTDPKAKVIGTMPERGTQNATLTTQGQQYTISDGHHSGAGKVTANISGLTASVIKKDSNVGGVIGTLVPDYKFTPTFSYNSNYWGVAGFNSIYYPRTDGYLYQFSGTNLNKYDYNLNLISQTPISGAIGLSIGISFSTGFIGFRNGYNSSYPAKRFDWNGTLLETYQYSNWYWANGYSISYNPFYNILNRQGYFISNTGTIMYDNNPYTGGTDSIWVDKNNCLLIGQNNSSQYQMDAINYNGSTWTRNNMILGSGGYSHAGVIHLLMNYLYSSQFNKL